MVSDPSALLLLIWNSLPQKFREMTSAEQFRSQIGTWGGGSAHARSAQTADAYVLFFCCF